MNIVLREFRANLKSLIIWSIGMAFLIFAGMVKYSGFEAAGESAKELMDKLPITIRSILGMMGVDLTSILGYYAIFFLYFMLLAGIHAITLGAIIISKEERDKTADFLFTKPVERKKVITSKLIAVFINILILNIVTLVSSIIFVGIYNKGESINLQIAKLMVALFILQIVFAVIGLAISGIAKNTKKATSYATTFLLATFMLSIAIDIYRKINFLEYLTPFKYFKAVDLVRGGSYEPIYLIISAGIVIGGTVITYITYQKRDFHV